MSQTVPSRTIGFIGLGLMGRPMVSNLLKDGHRVRVFNRTAGKAMPLVEEGAVGVESPEETVEPGGLLVTCLADDRALEQVFDEHQDLFSRLGRDGIHVSTGTISPDTSRRFADRHAARGGHYVAAPMMGRPDAVAARAQLYLVSGPPAVVDRVRPLLESLGRAVYLFGEDPGAANVAKLAMNFLVASATEAIAEAITLTRKNQVDPGVFYEMFSETLFACPLYKNYGRQILSGQFQEALFRMSLGLKDLSLISQLAKESLCPMPFASLLRDRYLTAVAQGRGDWDWTGIAAEVAENAGL